MGVGKTTLEKRTGSICREIRETIELAGGDTHLIRWVIAEVLEAVTEAGARHMSAEGGGEVTSE